MIWPVYCVYVLCVGFIRAYKWIERQVIRVMFPFFKAKAYQLSETAGIILHSPGDKPWTERDSQRVLAKCRYNKLVHLHIKNNEFFTRAFNLGTLGVGEAYMEGLFGVENDLEELTEVGARCFENNLLDYYWNPWNRFLEWLELHAFNLQTRKRAFEVIRQHYHLGDDLFERMLDRNLQYTCGYWAKATDLNQAQIDKMHLIAKKLDLQPGMRVLDIGEGRGYYFIWGFSNN